MMLLPVDDAKKIEREEAAIVQGSMVLLVVPRQWRQGVNLPSKIVTMVTMEYRWGIWSQNSEKLRNYPDVYMC